MPVGAADIRSVEVSIRLHDDNDRDDDSSSLFPLSSSSLSSSLPPSSIEDLFYRSEHFSQFSSSSSFASAQRKEKLRCFRGCFDVGDGVGASLPRASSHFPAAFGFLATLFRYFLSVSNNGLPFFTCAMLDASLATIVSPVVANPVLSELMSELLSE